LSARVYCDPESLKAFAFFLSGRRRLHGSVPSSEGVARTTAQVLALILTEFHALVAIMRNKFVMGLEQNNEVSGANTTLACSDGACRRLAGSDQIGG
jgi:hypothetical protein